MRIVYEGVLYEVLEADFLRMQQRKPVMRTKLRDLASGKVRETSFQPSDSIEEVELERQPARFIYESKGEYWFHEEGDKSKRFSIPSDVLSDKAQFLAPQMEVTAYMHDGAIIDVQLPVKIEAKVIEAPPTIKGNTSSGGTKTVVIETGAKVQTPLFIERGDIIRVNTQTGEYSERVQKA